jgi:hypothetical protein
MRSGKKVRKKVVFVENETYKVTLTLDILATTKEEAKTSFLDALNEMEQEAIEGAIQVTSKYESRKEVDDLGYFGGGWQLDDIIGIGEGMKYTITEEMAREIAEGIVRLFDASVGINWDVIDSHVLSYGQDKGFEVYFKELEIKDFRKAQKECEQIVWELEDLGKKEGGFVESSIDFMDEEKITLYVTSGIRSTNNSSVLASNKFFDIDRNTFKVKEGESR